MDNLDASVAILKKLTEDWKALSVKQSSLEALGDTVRSFRHKVPIFFFCCPSNSLIEAHTCMSMNHRCKCVVF